MLVKTLDEVELISRLGSLGGLMFQAQVFVILSNRDLMASSKAS